MMSFCNWRRNKTLFKVRELLRRCFLQPRYNVESRLKDALEKESVFVWFLLQFRNPRNARPKRRTSDSGAEFNLQRTSLFVNSDGKDSQVKYSQTARFLKDFLKSKFLSLTRTRRLYSSLGTMFKRLRDA